jgi:hypothetical protein
MENGGGQPTKGNSPKWVQLGWRMSLSNVKRNPPRIPHKGLEHRNNLRGELVQGRFLKLLAM